VRKILIVDDEPAVLHLLRVTFDRAGYAVRLAPNADEAKAALEGEDFDVVISDVKMPGTNGYELVQWIARNHPATRTLLMSGFDTECSKYPGSSDYRKIAKPFVPKDIVAAVDDVLRS